MYTLLYFPLKIQDVRASELLDLVKSSLIRSKMLQRGHSGAIKTLCDMLLTLATTYRNTLDVVQNHQFALMVSHQVPDGTVYVYLC